MSGAATASPGIEPSRRFGRYLVHERIGRGGMGEVWLASAEGPHGFRKRVVLKIVRQDLAERRDLVDMLIREAAIAARLNHPNLVQVFDLDQVDGTYFFAMEHVAGYTMAEIVRRAQARSASLPPWFLLAVIASCCDGLQYAHEVADEHGQPLGLVHRDISLGNIMVGVTGNVTILDFGIAVSSAAGLETESGMLKGKFQYMPPETIRGDAIDRRCDIYGLGVVMYIALTQRVPYPDLADYELLRAIVSRRPTPVGQLRGLAPPIARIVETAMAHDRDERYPDCAAFGAAVREQLRDRGVPSNDEIARFVADLFAPEEPGYDELSSEVSIDVIDLADDPGSESDLAIPEARDDSPSQKTTPVTAVPPSATPGEPAPGESAPSKRWGPIGLLPPIERVPDDGEGVFATRAPRRAAPIDDGASIFDGWTRAQVRRADTEESKDPPPRWPWR